MLRAHNHVALSYGHRVVEQWAFAARTVRLVTHLDVDRGQCAYAANVLAAAMRCASEQTNTPRLTKRNAWHMLSCSHPGNIGSFESFRDLRSRHEEFIS